MARHVTIPLDNANIFKDFKEVDTNPKVYLGLSCFLNLLLPSLQLQGCLVKMDNIEEVLKSNVERI